MVNLVHRKTWIKNYGEASAAQICRTWYSDDGIITAHETGSGQSLILGAGLDTRPHRQPGLKGIAGVVFEGERIAQALVFRPRSTKKYKI